MNRRTGNNGKRKIRIIISAALVLVILVCASVLIVRVVKQKKAQEEFERLKEEALKVQEREEAREPETKPEPEQATEPEQVAIPYEGIPQVDFEGLWEENTDICGWITIPGTNVDYPVLRNESSKDPHDTYYLEYNLDGSYGRPGTIYMEPCNSGAFTDFNTVLYGHNMNDGSMFADLHKFDDESFFKEHEYVYVATPEKILVYQIFAKVDYDNRHIMMNFDFDEEAQRQDFLDSLKDNRSMNDKWREGAEVTPKDRMVTLSTCIKGDYSKRLLVEAVLIDEYDNK